MLLKNITGFRRRFTTLLGAFSVLLPAILGFSLTAQAETYSENAFAPALQEPEAAPTFGRPSLSLELPEFENMIIPTVESIDGMPSGQRMILDGAAFVAQLSPQGTYAVVRETLLDAYQRPIGAALHVWTLDIPTPIGEEVIPIFPSISQQLNFEDPYAGSQTAISPDERYVAVELSDGIALYTLPELELSHIAAASPRSQGIGSPLLVWSPDSRFVANVRYHQLFVLDTHTGQTYTYNFEVQLTPEEEYEYDASTVMATEAGWLLDFAYSDATFLSCTWRLENCQSYTYNDGISAWLTSSPDGTTVLTHTDPGLDEDHIETGLWALQDDGTYQLQEEMLNIPTDLVPRRFSPSGEYVFFEEVVQSRGEVRRTSDWSLIATLPSFVRPIWFPDENYFLDGSTYDGVSLYRLGEDTPYEALNYYNLLTAEQIERGDASVVGWTVDINGKFVLWRDGYLNLVIPINYETPTS